MADAIVADFATGLLSKLVSLAAEEVIQAWNFYEDLEKLREKYELIGALLYDAHTKNIIMSTAQNWFNKLEAVVNVADAFMDELAYEVTRQKVENSRKVLNFLVPSKNTLIYRFKVAHKIKSIQASFDKLFKLAEDLGLQPVAYLGSTVQARDIRSTPSYEDKSLIVGRGKDVSYLVQKVCENHEEDLRVVAVVGMGGQGKTTLARMVFNSDDVINMFPKRIWITVSDDFNFIKILNQMVESLTSTNLGLTNEQGLVNKLRESLKGEKFILVLDDVWNEKPEKWDNLRNSLHGVGGANGSSILVTTRKQEVVDAMRRCVHYQVEKLLDEDSYELFKKIAFSDGGVLETEAFAALGRSMVERCGGLPLAIKALGGLLYSKKSKQEWSEIQNSDTWQSKDVLPSLKLSYDNLPYLSLKQCFVYCSIMPKDSVIYKDELVQIWMALGFLLPPRRSTTLMEDIGSKYFNILLWNSLLQDVERDELGNIISCKMHDLVHDLATNLSKHHSVTVTECDELYHIFKPKYVWLDEEVSDIKPTILKRNVERVQVLYAGADILGDMLPYITHLTVLVLNTDKVIEELPSSLRKMKYLKHLDISSYRSRLPTYIVELYNLQSLRVWNPVVLPKNFCTLINLRHLVFRSDMTIRRCVFIGIERLTCLQTLPHFVVNRDQNCFVGQLGGLKNLRGKLDLYGLKDVANIEEARKANLSEKPNIQRLLLNWRYNAYDREDREYCNDEDVMKGLEPHPDLKELTIDNFMGKKFASWIRMMTNLVKITLKNCNRCEVLPPLGHLPKLSEMLIQGMNNVKVMRSDLYGGLDSGSPKTGTTMYPSLTKLIFRELQQLEEWVEDQSAFPKLESLVIMRCPRLRKIPNSCFPSLKELDIQNLESSMILETMRTKVRSLTSLSLTDISEGGGGDSSSSIIGELLKNNSQFLTYLQIYNCKGLTCLTVGVSLETLDVRDCPDLISINIVEGSVGLNILSIGGCPSSVLDPVFARSVSSSTLLSLNLGPFSEELDEFPWPFSSYSISFPNLIWLTLGGWEKLNSILPTGQTDDDRLSSTFPALTRLEIRNFKGLKALPDSIAKLPSLKELEIHDCKNLESLPTFDKSHTLQLLYITECPILKERYTEESGPEWFKIQHIPHVKIKLY